MKTSLLRVLPLMLAPLCTCLGSNVRFIHYLGSIMTRVDGCLLPVEAIEGDFWLHGTDQNSLSSESLSLEVWNLFSLCMFPPHPHILLPVLKPSSTRDPFQSLPQLLPQSSCHPSQTQPTQRSPSPTRMAVTISIQQCVQGWTFSTRRHWIFFWLY